VVACLNRTIVGLKSSMHVTFGLRIRCLNRTIVGLKSRRGLLGS